MLRKRLFQKTGMLAVLSLAVLSCTKDEVLSGGRVADNVIGFGITTDVNAGTRPETRSIPADDQPLLLLEPGGNDTLPASRSNGEHLRLFCPAGRYARRAY